VRVNKTMGVNRKVTGKRNVRYCVCDFTQRSVVRC
jgi:hypothetical protein